MALRLLGPPTGSLPPGACEDIPRHIASRHELGRKRGIAEVDGQRATLVTLRDRRPSRTAPPGRCGLRFDPLRCELPTISEEKRHMR
jgi:hypothetical protein